MKAMKPSEVKEFVIHALTCRPAEIPYISGPPGIGKSDLYQQVAEEFNLKLVTEHLSQKLPEDLTGMPMIDPETKKAKYVPFDTFPLEGDKLPKDENGEEMDGWLVFLDELADANDDILSAIYSLLLGRKVGGRKLHPKALLCAAGNRSTDSALARELPDTLITRMLICEMKVSVPDWVDWANNICLNTNERVVQYIEKNPDMLLSTMSSEDRQELESYPTPRGWNKVFGLMNNHERRTKTQAGEDGAGAPLTGAVKHGVQAAVGDFAARGFIEFYEETLRIPYAWDVAAQPSSVPVPPTSLGRSKLTQILAVYYSEQGDNETVLRGILQFMNRMPSENSAMFVQLLKEKMPDNMSSKDKIASVQKTLGTTLMDL